MYQCARFPTGLLMVLVVSFVTLGANANPVTVDVLDDFPGPCDPLSIPQRTVEELGVGFPPDELIDSFELLTGQSACFGPAASTDNPAIPNALVFLFNHTPFDFSDVWYVADRGTGLSNWDGSVNGRNKSFKIDRVGINRPLVWETMTPDGIFESGEEWRFIIQDYTNSDGLSASRLDSLGVPSEPLPPAGVPLTSSGSIIAIPVPEPGAAALLVIGGVVMKSRRRIS
jgi:hypothetical protein